MSRTSSYQSKINTDSADTEALLLLSDGALVAILVQLSDQGHGKDRGQWVVEATFGLIQKRAPESFSSLSGAAEWVSANVGTGRFDLDRPVALLN